MFKRTMFSLLFFAAGLVGSAMAQESEKRITREQLPAAVQKSVDERSQGATIRGFNEVREHGKTFYEAEMKANGHGKNVLFDATGNLVEIEEEVTFDSLPAEVRSGLQAKAGSGKLGKVESLTKQGKIVAYEAKVMSNGKRSEIQVGPDGKTLDHEE